ncbi:MAG TPA: porin family protein [Bacteroidales bacterium]|nr:porin family protein [Bacteroidales bacterium]
MRKTFLSFLLLIPCLALTAQNLHIQVGPTFSKLNLESSAPGGNSLKFDKTVTGYTVQLGLDYLDLNYFNLSTGFGYLQKGGKDSVNTASPEMTLNPNGIAKIRLDYITLNTVANLKFPIKGLLVPYVFAGPRLDYLMNYEEDTRVFGFYDDYAKVNRLIYGVIAGGGINVKLMRLTFGLSFDYYFNFNKPVDCTLGGTAVKISERTFAVNAKVGLRLK